MHRTRLSNRLQGYDYSRNVLYFITSCVHDRVCFFGEIKDGKMFLNEYGQIAEQQWLWLQQQYPYIVSHSFVVMPNHVHGIIEIDDHRVAGTDRGDPSINKIKSLSELMGAYKTTTSKQIHLLGLEDFKWQRSFHDHIIRNEEAYLHISNYILNNPSNWKEDRFYKDTECYRLTWLQETGCCIEQVICCRDRSRPVPTTNDE